VNAKGEKIDHTIRFSNGKLPIFDGYPANHGRPRWVPEQFDRALFAFSVNSRCVAKIPGQNILWIIGATSHFYRFR